MTRSNQRRPAVPWGIQHLEPRRLLAAGELLNAFGAGGFAVGIGGAVNAVVDLGDNRVLLAGANLTPKADIVALDPNGLIDPSKLQAGGANLPFTTILALAANPAIGGYYGIGSNTRTVRGSIDDPEVTYYFELFVFKLLPSGQLDTRFDKDGRRLYFTYDDRINIPPRVILAVTADGKPVVLTYSGDRRVVQRFTPRGGVADPTFDTAIADRIVTRGENGHPSEEVFVPWDMVQLPDGKLRLAVQVVPPGAASTDDDLAPGVLGLNADGTLDTGFGGGDGFVQVESVVGRFTNVALDADGKLLAVGLRTDGTKQRVFARMDAADGNLDTSFSGDGVLQVPSGAIADTGTQLAPLEDGSFLYFGREGVFGKIAPSGAVDADFGERIGSAAGVRPVVRGDGVVILDRRALATTDVEPPIAAVANRRLALLGTEYADGLSVGYYAADRVGATRGGIGRTFDRAGVDSILVEALGGNDSVTSDAETSATPLPVRINGGGGDDTLAGGRGNDTINGGDGNDAINGNKGNDRLFGDAGDDYLTALTGRDFFSGGEGNDRIAVSLNLYPGITMRGDAGNDRITGGFDGETIDGGTGNDTINAGPGDDSILAQGGNDNVLAGSGDDTVYGMNGNDRIEGEEGDDSLFGGRGSDLLIAGAGNDVLAGNDGEPDTLFGNDGQDSATADAGDVVDSVESVSTPS